MSMNVIHAGRRLLFSEITQKIFSKRLLDDELNEEDESMIEKTHRDRTELEKKSDRMLLFNDQEKYCYPELAIADLSPTTFPVPIT